MEGNNLVLFDEVELDKNSVWVNFAQTTVDDKSYNIDASISVKNI